MKAWRALLSRIGTHKHTQHNTKPQRLGGSVTPMRQKSHVPRLLQKKKKHAHIQLLLTWVRWISRGDAIGSRLVTRSLQGMDSRHGVGERERECVCVCERVERKMEGRGKKNGKEDWGEKKHTPTSWTTTLQNQMMKIIFAEMEWILQGEYSN